MRGESAAAVAAAAAAAAARPGKRPLRALSAAEKMEAIQRVHEGESKASVARDIGVPESTLRGWCKSEHKIRGMARNSSTPDSEAAHSPASSTSGHPANNSNMVNSEDEGVSPPKRQRTSDNDMSAYAASLSSDLNGYKPTTTEYLNLLNNLISTGSVSPTQGALLCQQLGLFSNTTTTSSVSKQQQQQQQQQPLSFVENGFQYSSSSSKSHKRASTSSAIAPTSHVDSVSKSGVTRKSLPPAAEAPLTSLPLSPRRGNSSDYSQIQQQPQMQQQQLQQHSSSSSSSSRNIASNSGKKIDSSLLHWLDQSSKYMGLNAAGAVNSAENLIFWQYYAAAAQNLANLTSSSVSKTTPVAVEQVQQQTTAAVVAAAAAAESSEKKYKNNSQNSSSARKSPSKSRALIDELVCSINNNNESARRSLNLDAIEEDAMIQQQQPTMDAKEDKEEEKNLSLEEALQHARVLSKWLEKYSDPINSVSLVYSMRAMISNLEKKVSPVSSSSSAARRKSSRKATIPQSISQ